MNSTTQGKTYADFPRITHSGKYGVVFADAAYTSDGGLYYGSWTGSKQMCRGHSGRRSWTAGGATRIPSISSSP